MPFRALCATLLLCIAGHGQSSLVNFESGPVHPVRLSPDRSRLFVCNAAGGLLSVFDLRNPDARLLLAEIPVGIDPVSVQPRTDDEVWVANLLSDSVSIVSLDRGCVVATIRVPDEPSDIAFAGGLAFVTTATTDLVQVFDAVTRAPAGSVQVFGKDPRALAVSPDGRKVYAVVQRSGNGTTTIPDSLAPLPPPPTNSLLPPAPRQGIIVRADEGLGRHHYRAVFRIAGELRPFAIEALRDHLELAWALTVHKSQGSELDAVALILPHDDLPLVTRELIYTGITRARTGVALVGARQLLIAGGKRCALRYSGLANRLRAETRP